MKVTLIILITTLAFIASGCLQVTQPIVPPVKGTPPTNPANDCRLEALTIVLDKTMSEADDVMPQFAHELQKSIWQCTEITEVVVISIGLDGEASAFRAVPQRIRFPLRELSDFDEATASAKAAKLCGIRAECRKRVINEEREAYENTNKDSLSAYETKFQTSLDALRAEILKKAEKEAPFSDIGEQAQRIAKLLSSHVIWITDAEHNTTTPLQKQNFPNSKVLIGLLPTRTERSREFEKRFSKTASFYPDADITTVTEIDDKVLSNFLKTR